jgi:hypothetical protein
VQQRALQLAATGISDLAIAIRLDLAAAVFKKLRSKAGTYRRDTRRTTNGTGSA